MKNGNEVQRKLADSPLFKQVVEMAERIRDGSEYDRLSLEDRRLAILCHFVEELAEGNKARKARVDKWLDTPQEALDNHTPRQMGVLPP